MDSGEVRVVVPTSEVLVAYVSLLWETVSGWLQKTAAHLWSAEFRGKVETVVIAVFTGALGYFLPALIGYPFYARGLCSSYWEDCFFIGLGLLTGFVIVVLACTCCIRFVVFSCCTTYRAARDRVLRERMSAIDPPPAVPAVTADSDSVTPAV